MNIECCILNDKLNDEEFYPSKATAGSAGIDLRYLGDNDLILAPNCDPVKVHVGLSIHIDNPNYVAFVLPRSSSKHGLANTIGTVDSDYTGEIFVKLVNHTNHDIVIKPMERIAQYVLLRTETFNLIQVDAHVKTERGAGGDGSTGRI